MDFDVCESHGKCMELVPEVFEVRDDGCLYLLEEHPDASLAAQLEAAVEACPTAAIDVVATAES